MWPVILRVLRQYAPAITLPFAALIGIIGYNLENILSDKYTPYNGQYISSTAPCVKLIILNGQCNY